MGEKIARVAKRYRKYSRMNRQQLLTATLERAEKNLLQQQQIFEFAQFCQRHGIMHNTMQEYNAGITQYFLTEVNL